MLKTTVFLGGTCNGSRWRDQLIALLEPHVSAFNPVVENWDVDAQIAEQKHRLEDDFVLYVLTPLSPNTYSIAEAVDDSNKRPRKTLFLVLDKDADPNYDHAILEYVTFGDHQRKALKQVTRMILDNKANVFSSLEKVAEFLNAGGW